MNRTEQNRIYFTHKLYSFQCLHESINTHKKQCSIIQIQIEQTKASWEIIYSLYVIILIALNKERYLHTMYSTNMPYLLSFHQRLYVYDFFFKRDV